MAKITFLGAGSFVFAKSILGDCMLCNSLRDVHIALYDIDSARLRTTKAMIDMINQNANKSQATITSHLGVRSRRTALRGANYIVNAVQIGGYKPCTVTDFEVPKKYGLRQTIADTLGIGGIFRALRTIPVLLDFARDIEDVCPDAWLLNYSNPMAMATGGLLHGSGVKAVGLCHSVQGCASGLLKRVDMSDEVKKLRWSVAGINHMAWLLEIKDGSKDLYPEIKKRAAKKNRAARKKGAEKHKDMVRLEMMRHFGYYITESSEHTSEYLPYWIKSQYPELIEEFNIPLDDYIRISEKMLDGWEDKRNEMINDKKLTHKRSHEYASSIFEAIETDTPARIHGNILNNGLITNLPDKAIIEGPCLVDGNGVQGCFVGELPEQLAALNRTNINVQLVTIEAALTGKRDKVYQAAMLDPHTAAELPLDQIRNLCDDLIEAHGDYLPKYK